MRNYPMGKFPHGQISVCIFPMCMSPLRSSPSSVSAIDDVCKVVNESYKNKNNIFPVQTYMLGLPHMRTTEAYDIKCV